jgi:hypothetical protein
MTEASAPHKKLIGRVCDPIVGYSRKFHERFLKFFIINYVLFAGCFSRILRQRKAYVQIDFPNIRFRLKTIRASLYLLLNIDPATTIGLAMLWRP